jgi:hypothetical protein
MTGHDTILGFDGTKKILSLFLQPGGVAPQEQKTRVRIPPEYKVFRGNNKFDLIFTVCVLKREIKSLAQNYI